MIARLALMLFCALHMTTAGAAQRYALLVGVGRMPGLPASSWLEGPAHDVAAMRAALEHEGFSRNNIEVLGDASAVPTRATILASLARIAARAAPGDVVLLYWSGHGVLQRSFPGQRSGPLGHGVRLLSQDSSPTAGGVASSELSRVIDQLSARDARVIAIFDTCHAAGTTRAAQDGLVWRGMAASSLARPRAPFGTAQPRPGFIGFFAAEAQQRTAESRHTIPGQAAGLFTRALIGALGESPDTYKAWAATTVQRYRQVLGEYRLPASRWPSPVFAGTLEMALWQDAAAGAAWLVQRDARGWYLPYGQLDGIRIGDRLERGGARWQVQQVGWGEARLSQPDAPGARTGWAGRIAAPSAPALTLRRSVNGHAATLRLPDGTQVNAHVRSGQIAPLREQAARISDLLALPPVAGQPFLEAWIEVQIPGQPLQRLPLTDGDLGELPIGTLLHVIVENRGSGSVDLGIAHLPLTGTPARVYPAFAADSNRMPPGIAPAASRFEQQFEVTGPDLGVEWLALVAAPAANGTMPRRFALLATLPDTPVMRGHGITPEVRFPDSAQLARLRWTSTPAKTRRSR